MILVLEILFTILAWRKGWKWKALLPTGIFLFISLLLGVAISVSGGSQEISQGFGLILDIMYLVVLGVMIVHAPKQEMSTKEYKQASSDVLVSHGK